MQIRNVLGCFGRTAQRQSISARRRIRKSKSLSVETLESRQMLSAVPVISEFMASNGETLFDGYGNSSDWIEIYNAGDQAIDLAGWHLTDNAAALDKWTFPSSTLNAGDYLVVFASNNLPTVADPAGNLHTNFKLSSGGEYLALTRPDLSVAWDFSPEYPVQVTDISYGSDSELISSSFLAEGENTNYLVPTDESLGVAWTQPGFVHDWDAGPTPIGFEGIDDFVTPDLSVDDPVLHYQFNNTTDVNAPVVDSSSANTAASFTAGASLSSDIPTTGVPRGAGNRSIGGPNGVLATDNFDLLTNVEVVANGGFTFETWFQWDGGENTMPLINYADYTQLRLLGQSGTLEISFTGGGSGSQTLSQSVTPGEWHYVAVVFDTEGAGLVDSKITGNLTWYFDSNIASGSATVTKGTFGDDRNRPIGIGVDARGTGSAVFDGLLFDPRVTLRALTPDDLLYGQGTIKTDIAAAMLPVNSTVYLRHEFDIVDDPSSLNSLTLNMKYDDGFVAYLNGTEVARRNAPGVADTPLSYDAAASADRTHSDVVQFESIDLNSYVGLLQTGQNVLAIQGLNLAADDDDFLLAVELFATESVGIGVFFATPTPGAVNSEGFAGFLGDTTIDTDGGFFSQSFVVSISNNSPAFADVEIRYTTDGSEPTATTGTVYAGPITIDQTTVLRAAAFKTDFDRSNVDTGTYIFVDDVVTQTRTSTIAAGFPSSSVNEQVLQYGLNSGVLDEWGESAVKESLLSIPTMSIVTDLDNLFDSQTGIFVNAQEHGLMWERPGSLELINPDGTDGFQVEMGLRIRGGFSRFDANPKHAFRLFFRNEYGDSQLNYPLFEDEGVNQFDKFDLRTTQNYSWSYANDPRNTFVHDVFSRDAQGLMDQPYTRSRYYHLYINGIYWGLFQSQERVSADYAVSYFGGQKENYDVIKSTGSSGSYTNEATDGTLDAYRRLWEAFDNPDSGSSIVGGANNDGQGLADNADYFRIQGMNPDGTRNPAFERLLDVDAIIDYAILIYYTGDRDGANSHYIWPRVNNYYGTIDRENPDGFKFYEHDSEHSLGTGEDDMVSTLSEGGDEFRYFNPIWMHEKLSQTNEEYKTQFSDRLNELFFNAGILTETNADALVDFRANQIDSAIIAESARWGSTSLDKNTWQNAINDVHSFLNNRTTTTLDQIIDQNWYLETDVPTLSHSGGDVNEGFQLTISPSEGIVYYTSDGSDPRAIGGGISSTAMVASGPVSISISENTQIRTRAISGGEWSPITEAIFVTHTPALRITEIHYNPAAPTADEIAEGFTDKDDFEFLELQNTSTETLDLANFQLTSGVEFTFGNIDLAPDERIVIVRNRAAFVFRYSDTINIAGSYGDSFLGANDGFQLDNGGEIITLVGSVGEPIHDFTYADTWHPTTDGGGYSLTVVDPLDDLSAWGTAAGWLPSEYIHGSPGADDGGVIPGTIVINEIVTNGTGVDGDWIELQNTTSENFDIGHWYLSDDELNPQKYRFPAGTILAAGGFLILNQTADFDNASNAASLTQFELNELGGGIYLRSGDDQGVVTSYLAAASFAGAEPDSSFGRYQATADVDFTSLRSATPGAANDVPTFGPILINEIMYHPISGDVEFIELYNRSFRPIVLNDGAGNAWQFTNGIQYTFDVGATIPAFGHTVLIEGADLGDAAAEAAAFRAANNVPASVDIGVYALTAHGILDNGGEKLELSRPGTLVAAPVVSDWIRYNDRSPWPTGPDGGNRSLARTSLSDYTNDSVTWAASNIGGTPGQANQFEDSTPPTDPSNLVGRISSSGLAELAWAASSDPESGIDYYRIYRDDLLIGTTPIARFTDTSQWDGSGTISYEVSAVNAEGLESNRNSTPLTFTTQTIHFQQGVDGHSGAEDSDVTASQSRPFGGSTQINIDGGGGLSDRSALIKWGDLNMPAGATVVAASITLTISDDGDLYDFYPVLRTWSESQATWNEALDDQPWEIAGVLGEEDRGDQIGTLNGSVVNANTTELNAAGVAMVQSWIDNPSDNHGVVIAGPVTSTNSVVISSSENPNVEDRPQLNLSYVILPVPVPGDLDLNNTVDSADADLMNAALAAAVQTTAFDLNSDGQVNVDDLTHLATVHLNTALGDANLDQRVDRADVVALLGNFGRTDKTGWASGNFNGDTQTGLADLAILQSNLNFVAASAPASLAVEVSAASAAASEAAFSPSNDMRVQRLRRSLAASPRRIVRAIDQVYSQSTSPIPSITQLRAHRLHRVHRAHSIRHEAEAIAE